MKHPHHQLDSAFASLSKNNLFWLCFSLIIRSVRLLAIGLVGRLFRTLYLVVASSLPRKRAYGSIWRIRIINYYIITRVDDRSAESIKNDSFLLSLRLNLSIMQLIHDLISSGSGRIYHRPTRTRPCLRTNI